MKRQRVFGILMATIMLIAGVATTALAQGESATAALDNGQPAQETAQPADQNATFSADQKQKAQEQLKQLGEMFGVETPKAAVNQNQPPAKEKSVADVADKALDMVGNMIAQIASTVEKVSPKIWEIMVRQQYAKAFGELVGPFGMFLVTLLVAAVMRRFWKLPENELNDDFTNHDGLTNRGTRGLITFLFPLIFCTIFMSTFFFRLADSIMYLMNPEFYAVKDLVKLLLAPGSM